MLSSADILQIANVVGPIVVLLFLLCFEACSSYLMSSSRNVWNVPPFSTALPKQLNLVPRTCRLTVQFSGIYTALYTECKYGRPLGQPWSSCAQERLVRPREFFLTARLSDWVDRYGLIRVVASLGTTKRFYSNRNYLYFPENLFTKKVKDSRDSARRWDALHSKSAKVQVQVQVQVVASLALEEMTHESIWMKEFSQEMVLFHDACIVCYLSNKR